MAADQGNHMLQYHINIIANKLQLLDKKDFCSEPKQIEQLAYK